MALPNEVRTKLVNSGTGVQVIKGSISENTGFIEGIVLAYSNLVHKPIVIIIATFLIFEYLALESSIGGPIHEIKAIAQEIQLRNDTSLTEKTIAKSVFMFFNYLSKFERFLIVLGFAWLPYVAKPSTNSLYICICHTLLAFLMRGWHTFTFILLANFHYVFMALRKPGHKLVVIILAIVVFFAGIDIGGKPIINKRSPITTRPSTATTII